MSPGPTDTAQGKGKRLFVISEIQDALEGSIVRKGNDGGFRPHAEAIYNRLRKIRVLKIRGASKP